MMAHLYQRLLRRHIKVRTGFLCILLLALCVRLTGMILLETWRFEREQAFGWEAGEIGYAIATGQGFSWPQTWRAVGPPGQMSKREQPVPTAWEAPIYPFIIAAAFTWFGVYTAQAAVALELFQILLSLLICFMLFLIGKQVFNPRVGLIASFIFAVYPAALHFSVQKVGYVTLFVLLCLLILHQTIKLAREPNTTRSFSIGVFIGIASLVNPTIFAFWPFNILWFFWTCRASWQRRLKHAAIIVLCLGATMTPWIIRNYLVFNQFVFIKPNFMREMALGTYGTYGSNFLSDSDYEFLKKANEAEMNTFYRQKMWGAVFKKPAQFIFKTIQRILTYWFRIEKAGQKNSLSQNFAGTAYYLILSLGLVGAWSYRRDKRAQLLIIFMMSMPLPFYLTWVEYFRYRFPIELVLILFASCSILSFGRAMLHSRVSQRFRPFACQSHTRGTAGA